ncbi:MAG: L-rhamnose mutarotase [bacterium]|nr:L-rhamnose mutarotase [Acidimicrobiia bacterium]MCY4649287.1 L-rhamnose mutarotase [bacterium]
MKRTNHARDRHKRPPKGSENQCSPFRVGQIVRLRAERRDDYIELHRKVWPEVLAMISACNITNYSIFEFNGLLLSYFEYTGSDWKADMAKMQSDPVTQRWWALTNPCQEPVGVYSGPTPWITMTEIFHHD